MRTKHLLTKMMLLVAVMLMGAGTAWADTYTIGWGTASGDDGTYKNFKETNGSVTGILSFSTAKNSSSSVPAYNENNSELRLYYNSGGDGGSITITPANGITITGFVMTTSTSPSVKYTVDGGTATSVSVSSNTYTVSDISASTSLTIQNVNTSNTQLRIKTIQITYTSSSSNFVQAPTFSPGEGTYYEAQSVTISTETEDATIYYTTDGSNPTTTSSVYTDAITISETTTVKAMAVKGEDKSNVVSATYTIKTPISGYAVDFESDLDCYVDWTLTNVERSEATNVTSPYAGNYFGKNKSNYSNMSFQTKEKVAYPASFTCYVSKNTSNTTSSSWKVQVSSDGSAWTDVKEQDATSMTAGTWVEFTADLKSYTDVYVRLFYSGSSAIRTVDNIVLTTYDPAELVAPVITVDENFEGSTTATITCSTTGATIYYSFDNSTWTEYTDALTITATTTIYAKATKGEETSDVVSKTATKVLPTPTVTISDTEITTDLSGETNVSGGTFAATVSYGGTSIDGATVVWSSSETNVAAIDETTGVVTLIAAGTTTITATFAGNTDYQETSATYELKVVDSKGPGSEANPYTVAQAIQAIDDANKGTISNVYVVGKVSQVDSFNSNYKSITYWISDDGTTTNQFEVYSGKGIDGADFASVDDVKVGDEVVIMGNITYYSKNSVYEFAANNQLVSLNRPADTTPSITLSTTTLEATASEIEGEIEVTYNNFTLEEADVVFYESDGTTTTNCDWIVASINASNNIEYIIEANTGAERTAYMKVYALDGDANEVYSQLITVTQAKYVAPDVTVDPAVAGVGAFVKVTSTEDITAGNYLIVYEGNDTHDAVAFNGALETLDAASNGISVAIVDGKIPATDATVAATFTLQPSGSLKSASGLYIGVSSNSNGLKTSEEATDYTNSFSIDESGNAVISAVFDGSTMSLRYNYASDNLRFRYYKNSGQQAIQLYKYDETATPTITAKVTAAGYATFCSEYALDFTNVEGLTAYKATISADKKVSFTEVTEVPAREGVLLKGAEKTYNIPAIASADAIDNAFIGVTVETPDVPAGIFVLMNPEGGKGVGFYKTTQAFTVGANTAYLPALAGDGDEARTFIALDEVTAIDGIAAEKMLNGEVYNLQGQRVVKAQKGLYIVNGKKVMVK